MAGFLSGSEGMLSLSVMWFRGDPGLPRRWCGVMGHERTVGWGREVGTWGRVRDCGDDQQVH